MQMRTDLALECGDFSGSLPPGVDMEERRCGRAVISRIIVSTKAGADALGKPLGRYITALVPPLSDDCGADKEIADSIKTELFKKIKSKFPLLFKLETSENGNPFLNFFRVLFTFGLVCFCWIFFRANSLSDAFYIIKNLFNGIGSQLNAQAVFDTVNSLGFTVTELIISFSAILLLIIVEFFGRNKQNPIICAKNPVARFAFYGIIAVSIFSLGVFSSGGAFIYFQF